MLRDGGMRGSRGACVGWKEARFEPPLLIADAVVQAVVVALLTFSTRAVADGALLLSAWVEVFLLRHHCRIKGWRYSAAEMTVCVEGARIELLLLIADALRMFRWK